MYYFANWEFLFALILVPIIIYWYYCQGKYQESVLRYPGLKTAIELTQGRHYWKPRLLLTLKLTGLIFLILALARPQKSNTIKEYSTEGIDIMLVIDISSSMRAVDFKPNRLEAAKVVARNFIEERHNDRIGLVVFAAEGFLQCPLTIDYDVLTGLLDQVDIIEEKYDGTAIGMALATAINRLRDSAAKSRVIVFLSDGRNNTGELDPGTAAQMAKTFDIKVYTIGAGTRGQAPYPVRLPGGAIQYRMIDVEIDEAVLNKIANITGGKYFRATDEESLSTIYAEISDMETSEIKVSEYYNYYDLYHYFLLPGLILIMLGYLLGMTIWRKTP
jgi:Ca-activated chloride channel family protein